MHDAADTVGQGKGRVAQDELGRDGRGLTDVDARTRVIGVHPPVVVVHAEGSGSVEGSVEGMAWTKMVSNGW